MLLGSGNPHVQYAGTFLGALGIYPCIANTITRVSNNTEGFYKRGVTLGFVIGCGNLNSVVSSNIYRVRDKPRYKQVTKSDCTCTVRKRTACIIAKPIIWTRCGDGIFDPVPARRELPEVCVA